MENCLFCKIVRGEIPSVKVFENKEVLAFLDISPLNRGHVLVIPKHHSRWIWDENEEGYCAVMKAVRDVANAQRRAFKTDWVQMMVAGMAIEHSHVHVIPRYNHDGHKELPLFENAKKSTNEELEKAAEEIRKHL